MNKKFGPIRLMQGVTVGNMFTYYFATVTSLLLFTFLPQFQPFLLAEVLNIPESQQGVLSGNLQFFAEIIILLSIGAWGTLSDKVGRKFVFSMGFVLIGLALYFYPNVDSILHCLHFVAYSHWVHLPPRLWFQLSSLIMQWMKIEAKPQVFKG